jgi:hypothetical protein
MSDMYTDQLPPERRCDRPEDPGTSVQAGLPKLGSLAQAARSKQLDQAKRLLIGVGLLMAVANFAILMFCEMR